MCWSVPWNRRFQKETSASKRPPPSVPSLEHRRKSSDALLSAGAPCRKWVIAKGYLSGGVLPRIGNMQFPPGYSLCTQEQQRVAWLGQKLGGLHGDSRQPLPSRLPQSPSLRAPSRPCLPDGTRGKAGVGRQGEPKAGKKGLRGSFKGCAADGEDSHESADPAQCDFTASREKAPRAGGRWKLSSRSARSEPPAVCARRAWDGLRAGQAAWGWGGEGRPRVNREGSRLEADLSALFLLAPKLQFPPVPQTPRTMRPSCRWRCVGALGARLGVRGGAQLAGIAALEGASRERG